MTLPPASSTITLPPGLTAETAALLLDFDGTLVDIAPSPEAVSVKPGVKEVLVRLREACGGALAIVTGRPIEQIDHFLPDIPTAVCGEHGVAMRRHRNAPIERPDLPRPEASWLEEANALALAWPGVRIERKAAGFVLHYRGCPEAEGALHQRARHWLEGQACFEIHPSKMAWEIRPAGIDKGHAVHAVMTGAPFAGRRPVFVGDDVTDEDGIRAARALGGAGYRIPRDFPDAQAFRAWLAALAEGHGWGA